MSPQRVFDRLAPLSGILSVVLSFGGFALIAGGGFAPQPATALDEIGAIIEREAPTQVFVGLYLDMLGSLAFVVFVARVWRTLTHAEPPPAWVSAWALGAGLLAVAASLIDKALFFAIFTRSGKGLEPAIAAVLFDAAGAAFALFGLFAGLFLAGVTIVVLRYRALPRWLGWLGAVAAVLALIGPASPIGPVGFLFVLAWIVAASVVLALEPPRRTGPSGTPEP